MNSHLEKFAVLMDEDDSNDSQTAKLAILGFAEILTGIKDELAQLRREAENIEKELYDLRNDISEVVRNEVHVHGRIRTDAS